MPAPAQLRILVAGSPGAGKSSWAREIGHRLGLPYTELDALFHGPGWQPRESFLDDVKGLASGEQWVTEWQYTVARPMLADRANTLIWLDLPLPIRMKQLIGRTVSRRLRREKLWADNEEMPLWRIFTEPNHIIRWGWRTRHDTAQRIVQLRHTHPDLTVIRIRSHKEAEEWLRTYVP